jgi:hypothetical protein
MPKVFFSIIFIENNVHVVIVRVHWGGGGGGIGVFANPRNY